MTDAEIIAKAEQIARIILLGAMGFEAPSGFVFRGSSNPRAAKAWSIAASIMEDVFECDLELAFANINSPEAR